MPHARCKILIAGGLAALLSGCATIDPGLDPPQINALLAARGAPALGWEKNASGAEEALIRTWAAEPMTVDRAVRTAMLRSPRLQAEYAQLGLARADIMEAIQIANPRFGIARLGVLGGPGTQLGLGLAMPLVDLLVLPARARLARVEFDRAKMAIAASVLGVGFGVEADWYNYVGAQQVADMRAAVATAMATSAELAQRYYAAGNISELQLGRETAAASEARIAASRALVAARLARLTLNTAIGLTGADADWQTSDRLPLPAPYEDDPAVLDSLANQGNLALRALGRQVEVLGSAAGITRKTRLLGDTTIGFEREYEADGSIIQGPSASIEIPIFNQGGARVTRAEARLLQARAALAALQLQTDNAVRLGAERVRVLSDVVRMHRETLVPARETIVERSQQQQNFMLIGVFELIQAKTQAYDAYQSYLDAIRDYWLARVDLMRVVGARLPSEKDIEGQAPAASEILAPAASEILAPSAPEILSPRGVAMDHSGHGAAAAAPAVPAMADMPGMDHSAHTAPGTPAPDQPPAAPPHQHSGQPQ